MINIMKYYLFVFIAILNSSCKSDNTNVENSKSSKITEVDNKFDSLYYYLNDYIISDLKASEVIYIDNNSKYYDSIYVTEFLEVSSKILIENVNDSSLLNKEYDVVNVPNKWLSKTEEGTNNSFFVTKIWISKDDRVQFTYVVRQVNDTFVKYKILLIRDKTDTKWKIGAIG
jgi:hypothetical protein